MPVERIHGTVRRSLAMRKVPLRRRWGVLLIAILALPLPASAEFVTSRKLSDWLDESARQGGDFESRTMALGFVAGIHDLSRDTVCTPDHVRGLKVLLGVRSWMKRNPDRWDEVAAITVRTALVETYPCPRETKP